MSFRYATAAKALVEASQKMHNSLLTAAEDEVAVKGLEMERLDRSVKDAFHVLHWLRLAHPSRQSQQ